MVLPPLTRPGVRTVPVSVVGELPAQALGTVEHKLPVQVGPPDTQVCAPEPESARHVEALPQLPVQLLPPLHSGQQLSTWPQPSEARPQVCPCSAQVLGTQLAGGMPHWFGSMFAPQYSSPVQLTPPLSLEHWYRPPQPFDTEPHLPWQAVSGAVGWHTGNRPQMLDSNKPHC